MMASGVLSFLRGIDLTRFPIGDTTLEQTEQFIELQNVRWLKLARTGLKVLPSEIASYENLEELDISFNQLASLEDLSELPNLKSLIAKSNLILETSLPPEIFHKELNVLDLQKNKLRAVPERLEEAEGLLVLNLADNQISEIPQTTFVNLCDLMHLDLSGNLLETLPAQMRRLSNLRIMNISNNPLGFAQLRQLPSLSSLKELYLANTQRTAANLPQSFEGLAATLEVIDLSQNQLSEIPDCLFECTSLKRINLSNNEITEVHLQIDKWHKLENLNLSNNQLTSVPASLSKLTNLRALYVSGNQLDFEGIPRSIGKLGNLEVFSASFNILETVPEGLTRCIKLRKMMLNNNKLITLPESIHFMPNLRDLDVRNNPSFVMPPKPVERKKEDEMSYNAQLRRMGQLPEKKEENSSLKKYERRIRLRKIRESVTSSGDGDKEGAMKVLDGLKEIGGKGENEEMDNGITGGKTWMDNLKGPTLDYNGVYDEFTGQSPGVTAWQIDNFYPVLQDDSLLGKFYTGDCYIILETKLMSNRDLEHKIYFWIGELSSLDKKACAAMHAVNLRNMLSAKSRTSRQEMNDEDDEFLDMFDEDIQYIAGGSESGFYLVEQAAFEIRLYCVEDASAPRIFPVPLKPTSLHPKQCLILDTGKVIFCWLGMMGKNVVKSKCRLIADKINKYERKGLSEVILVYQGYEESDFWQLLGGMPDKVRPMDLQQYRGPRSPRLYKVCLGSGYLELPQLNYRISTDHGPDNQPRLNLLPHLRLLPSLLESKGVYILDCTGQIFVWIGKHSQRLARSAAWKLASEMAKLPGRPKIDIRVTRELEGTETVGFRHMFKGWDNVLSIDYSRAVDTVPEKELQLRKDRQDACAADMSSLFLPRQRVTPDEEAEILAEEWSEDLESMKCFVLEGKKFVHLPEEEKGQFHSQNCYVFVCRYLYPPEKEDDEESDDDEEEEDNLEVIVYFWEGRDANQLGWLTFTFTLQKNLEKMFADKLVIRRMRQQQEDEKFLSHFDGNFLIINGKRFTKAQREKITNREEIDLSQRDPILLQTRSTGSMFTTRTVQVSCETASLNSEFCHILIVPFSGGGSGMVYGWIGRCAEAREARIMGDIMDEHLPIEFKRYSKQVINEGEEPENFFWVGIGADLTKGTPQYSGDADYLRTSRLFRCTNESGYFNVSEKCSDFCQADLQDDDIMLLDTGLILYLWVGSSASQTEVKFGLKAAAVYLQHLKAKTSTPRKLKAVRKGNENSDFKQCFHGWRGWN